MKIDFIVCIKQKKMKKLFEFFTIVLISTLTTTLSAQSQRLVLTEEFTQASCAPCASQNPTFNALLHANVDKITSIKYQTSWPGIDPMNADNPVEVQARANLYSVNGLMATLDGTLIPNDCNYYLGAPACLDQEEIDAAYAFPARFDIMVEASLVNGVLEVTTDVLCTQEVAGNLKLMVVLIEKVIDWGTAPGSNGEVVFYNVMKKFLPGVNGIALGNFWSSGTSETYTETINIDEINVYSFDELAVVAFVQDLTTREIYQTGTDMVIDITSGYDNSAAPSGISGLPISICSGEQTLSPIVNLTNRGNNTLNSATISYNINGEDNQVMEWTGSLETLQSENVNLDPYTFTATSDNIISVSVSMPNGVEDENSEGSTINTSLPGSPPSGDRVEIEILTDGYGDETYWEIRNSEGDIISWGGNPNVGTENIGTGTFPPPFSPDSYGNDEQVSVFVELPNTDCYTFHITDYYGDGLLDEGYYQVNDFEGNMIISEDNLTDEEMNDFSGEEAVSIEELNISNFRIYPNPAHVVAHITMNLLEANSVTIEVVDLLGKVVYTEEFGNLPSGNHLFDVDASSIGTGLYLFNIYIGRQKVTERVSISK